MNSIKNLFGDVFSWGSHPVYGDGTTVEWLAGLILVLIVAMLWKQVADSID